MGEIITKEPNSQFSVVVYEQLTPYNNISSKSRCRIFYKGANRNGTFITDEFAEKLISTVQYAPIKGIYDYEERDFTDHGEKRHEGKIYGVVPENCNFKWEWHTDNDGELREYACVDILVYTGIYKEASEIVGKAQSMELYPPTIKGHWEKFAGIPYYVFEEASFLGLQVLGQETEPCFEGASFYSLMEDLKNYNLKKEKEEKKEEDMQPIFKLSNSEELKDLWTTLNPNFTEEKNWEYKYEILDVFDTFMFVYNKEEQKYENIYYTKDENGYTLGESAEVFALSITQEEKEKVEKMGSEFSLKNLFDSISEKEQKIIDLTNENSTLNQSNTELNVQISDITAQYNVLKEEKDVYNSQQKDALLEKFSTKLGEEIISKYKNDKDSYSVDELKRALAFEYVENTPTIFTKEDDSNQFIPKPEPLQGIEAILEKYKK